MKMGKIRKKMAAGVAVVTLMGALVMPVFAAEPQTGNMAVGYTEDSTYTLSIPTSVTLSETAGASQTVGLSAINVGTKQTVQIKVAGGISSGAVTLADVKDSTNTKTSTVSLTSGGAGIANDAVVATFDGESTTAPTAKSGGTLYFAALGNVPAGTYNGTINFSASIVDAN